jgi:hypothetical protein
MLIKVTFGCWTVRGLGRRCKRDDVKAAINSFLPHILRLQETKLMAVSRFLASSFLPPSLRSFIFKPSVGASGGILMAWDDSFLELIHHSIRSDNLIFSIINVYGPCVHALKPVFLNSLEQIFCFPV